MASTDIKDKLNQIALKLGIVVPSSEIYPPVGGFYDWGPTGTAIKNRVEQLWRDYFINQHGFMEVETALIIPEAVVKASGHLDHFTDPVTTCKYCGSKFRADHLLDENGIDVEGKTIDDINKIIGEGKILCLSCKKHGFVDTSFFNLMFKTNVGPVEGNPSYLRPETAQGTILLFPRIFKSQAKLPVGIAQIGKSFRNEISPRQGIIRLRELKQMELEYFFDPSNPTFPDFKRMENKKIAILTYADQGKKKLGKERPPPTVLTGKEAVEKKIVPNEIMAYFLGATTEFYEMCGIPFDKMHFRHLLPDEMPHYSGGNFDLEIMTSYGWIEGVGIAYRTDYDLKSHSNESGKDLSVVLPDGRRIIPHIVEPAFGVDRLIWTILEYSYRDKDKLHEWEWLDLPQYLAPYEVALFPLMKKDGLSEKAKEIAQHLRKDSVRVLYNETGSIGKRYARADEVGIKWAVTIDYDTLKDGTVTIRDRNSTKQERIKISEIPTKIKQ